MSGAHNADRVALSCEGVRRALARMGAEGRLTLNSDVREHVDECRECWLALVAARWKIAETTPDVAELREFMGDQFEPGVDSSWLLVDDWQRTRRESPESISAFYRETKWYIYNLVLWEASGQRPRYVAVAEPVLRRHHIESVLDFGAGVGTDTLKFADLGLSVVASDFDNLASRFLRWRAAKRQRNVDFIDADEIALTPVSVDMIWALDVVEHLPRPTETLAPLLRLAKIFVYDSEHVGHSRGRHPFHFQHDPRALEVAWASQGLLRDERCSSESGLEVFVRAACD